MIARTRFDLTPRARVMLDALRAWPRTVEELAKETRLSVSIVEVALTELRTAGRAAELRPGMWWVA